MIAKKKSVFSIILILFLLHIAAFSYMPLPDPSESRYASIAKEMSETDDYIMPQIWIEGEKIPFMSKPPFAFWSMALSIEIFGPNEFAVRLPSFTAGILLLVLMFVILKKYKDPYVAVTSVLITATTGGFYLLSSAVLVDIWLSLFSIGAIFLYFGFLKENIPIRKKVLSWSIFMFLALGFLTKGPVCLIFFGLPVCLHILLNMDFRPLRQLGWVSGIFLFSAITIPWFILAEQHTPGYLHYFFINENLMRFISPDKSLDLYSGTSHAVPKGTAILYTILVCLPWSLIIPIFYSWKKKKFTAMLSALKSQLSKIKKYACHSAQEYEFSIFSSGMVIITLFWCLSSHLMPYYMILTVPLFGVFTGDILKKHKFKLKYIMLISIILLSLYLIAYIPASIFVNRYKSTKYITQKAVELYREKQCSGKIVFIRRVKYSTYFYGENLILPHKKESVVNSFEKNFDNLGNLFVMKHKYLKRIPKNLSRKLKILYKDKYWMILKINSNIN